MKEDAGAGGRILGERDTTVDSAREDRKPSETLAGDRVPPSTYKRRRGHFKGYRTFSFHVPLDACGEVSEVLRALRTAGETVSQTAAFLYLIRAYKIEIMEIAEAKRRAEA